MYAAGLVLWEVLSRTKFGDITCGEYRLPFEEEIGQKPRIEDMQEAVSQEKKRPKLNEAWFKHPGLKSLAVMATDCWDQDAEARISASTICERVQSIITNEDNCLVSGLCLDSLFSFLLTLGFLVPRQASSVVQSSFGPNCRVTYNAANNNVTANGVGANSFLMSYNGPAPAANSTQVHASSNLGSLMLQETST